jgi:hypothetical protein
MQSGAKTVKEYLASLEPERRREMTALRELILKNLPPGYQEVMHGGMIWYIIPLSRYPETYNGEPLGLAALASQKNYMSLYLMTVYGDRETESWFKAEYAKSGKKLDMGKSCLRFKALNDIPLDLIKKTIARVSVDQYIESYEALKRKRGSH